MFIYICIYQKLRRQTHANAVIRVSDKTPPSLPNEIVETTALIRRMYVGRADRSISQVGQALRAKPTQLSSRAS